ncbi:hypothetical protein C4580_02110 [Candidatus Woesearchaeota archaeon]|nr:MAG: hypothetical protein C4580_02110 [Candidatus Woesearchaeota archaeon]
MWNVLEKLFTRDFHIKAVSPEIAIEWSIYKDLRKTHERKLELFNQFLLQTKEHLPESASALAQLRALFSTDDPFTKTKALEGSQSRLALAVTKKLKQKITPAQRNALTDLFGFLKSDKHEEFRQTLFLERALLERQDFALHLGEFKHLLEQEGTLLNQELDILTRIEDRIKALHEQEDPYHALTGNTVAAFVKQGLLALGIRNAQIASTGSTGRGTGPITSDYDIIVLVNPTEHEFILNTTSLGDTLNTIAGRTFAGLRDVEHVRMKTSFFYLKPQDVYQLSGNITLTNKRSAEIHIFLYDDAKKYQEQLSFVQEHETWAAATSATRTARLERLQQDTKLLKEYLTAANVYYEKKERFLTKNVTGVMMELLLREQRLTKLARDFVSMGVPWQENSFQAIRDRLLFHLDSKHIDRILGKRTELWETPETRLQRITIAMLRITQGKPPGYDLDDFSALFPQHFCAAIPVSSIKRNKMLIDEKEKIYLYWYNAESIIFFIQKHFPLETAHIILSGSSNATLYAAFRGKSGKYVYKKTLSLPSADDLLGEDFETLSRAAFLPSNEREQKYRSNLVDFFRDFCTLFRQ